MIGKALAQQITQTLVKLSTDALVKIFPGHNVITACSGTTTIVLVYEKCLERTRNGIVVVIWTFQSSGNRRAIHF